MPFFFHGPRDTSCSGFIFLSPPRLAAPHKVVNCSTFNAVDPIGYCPRSHTTSSTVAVSTLRPRGPESRVISMEKQ